MALESFKGLIVWQRSMELAEEIYRIARSLPDVERYNLVSQIQRASISIPSNIAEGYKRKGRKEYLQFLAIADASAAELETQLLLIERLYRETDTVKAQSSVGEVQKMLFVLLRELHAKP